MENIYASKFPQVRLEDYEQFTGPETIERIYKKLEYLHDTHVTNISSTYYGGGVAELLSSVTLLMNSAGFDTGWRIIQVSTDFFGITKKYIMLFRVARFIFQSLKNIFMKKLFTRMLCAIISTTTLLSSMIHSHFPLFVITRKKVPGFGVAM